MSYDEAIAAATPEQRAAFDKLLAEPVSATHDILAEDPNNPSPRAQWTHYVSVLLRFPPSCLLGREILLCGALR